MLHLEQQKYKKINKAAETTHHTKKNPAKKKNHRMLMRSW